MSLLLDKVLTALILPPGLMLAGLVMAFAVRSIGFRRTANGLAILSFAALWFLATPVAARLSLASLEEQFPALKVEDYSAADVAIVLGGAIAPPTDDNPYPDLNEGADRLFHALRLYRAGKVHKILLSGGQLFDPGTANNEAEAMAGLLVFFGVPREAILIEGNSRNTYENALFTADILRRENLRSGLLVTSASHMPRALATFRKLGLTVEPAVTDLNAPDRLDPFPLPLLPDASSLDQTARGLKEWIGVLVYRLARLGLRLAKLRRLPHKAGPMQMFLSQR